MKLRSVPCAILGLAAASVLGYAAWQRVDLFDIPYLWREARRLAELQAEQPENPAFEPTLNRGLNQLDWTLSTLIRLQEPEFLGGHSFRWVPMRSRDGGVAYVAWRLASEYPFDQPVDEGEGITSYFCGCVFWTVRALDSHGRLLDGRHVVGIRSTSYDEPPFRVEAAQDGPWDLLRARVMVGGCPRCLDSTRFASGEIELSLDRLGLVPHGYVTADDLRASTCGTVDYVKRPPVDESSTTALDFGGRRRLVRV